MKRVLLAVFLMLLFYGCVQFTPMERVPAGHRGYELYQQAEKAYTNGAVHNLHRRWDEAIEEFDQALVLISQIDIQSHERDLQGRVSNLLNEIAYDYRIALSNTDNVGTGSATAIISMALEDDRYSGKTKRELSRLLRQLPSAPTEEFEIPIVWNDVVAEKILLFQGDLYQERMTKWLSRSTRYLPMINRILAEEGVPLDLGYLPVVESGFNAKALSFASASGIWQFIPGTGREYGLKQDWWVDERRDPEKSTRAAAKYLRFLYNMFDDWELALASYNCGQNRVRRILNQHNATTFWEIRQYLPRETQNYVPLFQASLIIAKNPQKYGFYPTYEMPETYDIVRLAEPVNLELAAEICGVSKEEMQQLNPELRRWSTPNVPSYDLKVPRGTARGFHDKYARIPESRKSIWQQHRVRKGETLSHIASSYGTTVSAIVSANQLRNQNRISIGQTLLVPVQASGSASTVASASQPRAPTPSAAAPTTRSTTVSPPATSAAGTYVVKRGDTPSGIAQAHGISLTSLYNANDMNRNSIIKVGQTLRIPGSDIAVSSSGQSIGEYTVRQGDTPLHIAIQNNMTLSELLTLNGLSQNSTIYPGQKLKVNASGGQKTKIVHTVQSGESLWSIARKHGVSVSDLVYWNGYSSNNPVLHPGNKITIMQSSGSTSQATAPTTQEVHYTVKAGDNLWKIANQYSVSVDDIKRWNQKRSNNLSIGERLIIMVPAAQAGRPTPQTGEQVIHRVQSGDTLWGIARKYNTTTADIINQNQLSNPSALRVGDELKIFVNR